MAKCPKCGYEPKKEYCKCKNLTIWDLIPIDGKEYCRKCKKEVETTMAIIAFNNLRV